METEPSVGVAAAKALAKLGDVRWTQWVRGDGDDVTRLQQSGDPRAERVACALKKSIGDRQRRKEHKRIAKTRRKQEKREATVAPPQRQEQDHGGNEISSRFEQCKYGMEITKSGLELMGLDIRVIPCCKHRKVGKRSFDIASLEKISGFIDFSSGHDENTKSGVAYVLPSTHRCFSCRHFVRK